MRTRHQRTQPKLSAGDMGAIVAEQLRRPFRGEIWEYFKDTPMGRGYANAGDPFDICSANYLREVWRLIRTRPYGLFVLKAAVQILKTFTLEASVGYLIGNDPGDAILYFGGDDAAVDQAKGRTMKFLKSHPDFGRQLQDVVAEGPDGRFQVTTQEIYLPGMILRLWPLNLGSTQRNTVRYVFISDAFLSGTTGMISEAKARFTQHNTSFLKDYKCIIESQAGETNDDFDKEWQGTDQRILHVTCPACGMLQAFEWFQQRKADFVPVAPKIVASLDREAWVNHHQPLLISDERKHCGMRRGDGTKGTDGTYDDAAILRETHYECYHCASRWLDTPETRKALDESTTYVASKPDAPEGNFGFEIPAWAGQRIAWGEIMLQYLNAKKSAASGNYTDLRIWHQKRQARPWKSDRERLVVEASVGSYELDPEKKMPDEVCRDMAVDCQQDQAVMEATGKSVPGWFWYDAVSVDKFGNDRQLARGFCKSWEAWIAVQKKWKIPNERVVIDVGHWPDAIMLRAAAEAEEIEKDHPIYGKIKLPATWLLLAGDPTNRQHWKHPDGKFRPYSPPIAIPVTVFDPQGKRKVVRLKKVFWANVPFKMQLDAIAAGGPGMPKFEVLGRENLDPLTLQMETGNWTYESQMASEYYEEIKGKDAFTRRTSNAPNHYKDCKLMLLVRRAHDGMLGHLAVEVPPEG